MSLWVSGCCPVGKGLFLCLKGSDETLGVEEGRCQLIISRTLLCRAFTCGMDSARYQPDLPRVPSDPWACCVSRLDWASEKDPWVCSLVFSGWSCLKRKLWRILAADSLVLSCAWGIMQTPSKLLMVGIWGLFPSEERPPQYGVLVGPAGLMLTTRFFFASFQSHL